MVAKIGIEARKEIWVLEINWTKANEVLRAIGNLLLVV